MEKQLLILMAATVSFAFESVSTDLPSGPSALKGAINRPLPSQTIVDKDHNNGWFFENKAEQVVYCQWGTVRYNKQRHAYDEAISLADHPVVELNPQEKKYIALPTQIPSQTKATLLISFNKTTLEGTGMGKDRPLSLLKNDLGIRNDTWQIFKENGIPTVVPFSYIITLNNTTNHLLYCALFYVNSFGAQKFGPPQLVTPIYPQLRGCIHFPGKQSDKDIQLCIATENTQELLKKTFLTPEEMNQLYFQSFSKTNIFDWYLQGEFDILHDNQHPQGINVSSVGGGAMQRILRNMRDIQPAQGAKLEEYESKLTSGHPLYKPDAEIFETRDSHALILSKEELHNEHAFVAQRSESVRQAINKLFNEELIPQGQSVPTISLVFSGGGYRAMIETIGFLRGADDEEGGNIFDCALYMMGLSGSTWAINPLVVSGLTPVAFSSKQRTKLATNTAPLFAGRWLNNSLDRLISQLTSNDAYHERRFIEGRYGQAHGPVGIYGHSLAEALLDGFELNGKSTHHITLSDMRTHVDKGIYPLPISVAIEPGTKEEERIWFEFSPYYMGTHQENGSWIDTKLVGCSFDRGSITHYVPEYPLAHYMGIWGSAFAVTPKDIQKVHLLGGLVAKAAHGISSAVRKAYSYLIQKEERHDHSPKRITAGTIPNYSYNYHKIPYMLRTKPALHLIDGGLAKEGSHRHNFASVPALWRKSDIIIMCDSQKSPSTDLQAEHLLGSDEEARHLRLPFPNVTRSSLHKEILDKIPTDVVSIFVEPGAPIIIYIPCKKNIKYDAWLAHNAQNENLKKNGFDPDIAVTQYTTTVNFNYTPEEFDVLSGLAESIFVQSKDTIKQAIKEAIIRKNHNP